uniref:Uncharacterized protein n=1 Tax=Anguilla anguilla TaxID=7936 RepID=A0A0E9T5K4_ANGAN
MCNRRILERMSRFL